MSARYVPRTGEIIRAQSSLKSNIAWGVVFDADEGRDVWKCSHFHRGPNRFKTAMRCARRGCEIQYEADKALA